MRAIDPTRTDTHKLEAHSNHAPVYSDGRVKHCNAALTDLESTMQRPETQYTRSGDVNIAYQVFGDGPIDLVNAEGWLSNIEYAWESPDYARFLTKLGRFARVIVFDKRGTGMSDRDVGAATLEQRAEDIHAVLNAAGSRRAALFGSSEGGNMSIMFAATYPERVSAVVLFGSFARIAWAADYPIGETPADFEARVAGMLDGWGKPHFLDTLAPSVADDPVAQDWFATYLRYASSPGAAERLTRLNYQIDIRALLPAVQVPTLVLHREGDRSLGVAHAEYLADHIPSARLQLLGGADHLPYTGDQDELVGHIEEFLTGERSGAPSERVLLTVAMLDIVDSTAALASMGDERWRAVLEQLDHSVARRVSTHGGDQVKQTGDGYLLAFTGPTRAIECTKEIMRDAVRLGLSLRTGLHTGECERRGTDLSGIAVHLAARIMAQAEPQTVTTSQTVKDLVVGSGIGFEALGTRELKGIPGNWSLFAVNV